MKIKVSTRYDCRRTGVVGHYRAGSAHFTDQAGQPVFNQFTWNRSRNQQRNLETLTQLVGMRTQLASMTDPVEENSLWSFVIEPERPEVFADNLVSLMSDCDGVPMMTHLGEQPHTGPVLKISGSDQNIWFQII
jgi:hypothetical protein